MEETVIWNIVGIIAALLSLAFVLSICIPIAFPVCHSQYRPRVPIDTSLHRYQRELHRYHYRQYLYHKYIPQWCKPIFESDMDNAGDYPFPTVDVSTGNPTVSPLSSLVPSVSPSSSVTGTTVFSSSSSFGKGKNALSSTVSITDPEYLLWKYFQNQKAMEDIGYINRILRPPNTTDENASEIPSSSTSSKLSKRGSTRRILNPFSILSKQKSFSSPIKSQPTVLSSSGGPSGRSSSPSLSSSAKRFTPSKSLSSMNNTGLSMRNISSLHTSNTYATGNPVASYSIPIDTLPDSTATTAIPSSDFLSVTTNIGPVLPCPPTLLPHPLPPPSSSLPLPPPPPSDTLTLENTNLVPSTAGTQRIASHPLYSFVNNNSSSTVTALPSSSNTTIISKNPLHTLTALQLPSSPTVPTTESFPPVVLPPLPLPPSVPVDPPSSVSSVAATSPPSTHPTLATLIPHRPVPKVHLTEEQAAILVQKVYRGAKLRQVIREWRIIHDDDGDIFYYNQRTNECEWNLPILPFESHQARKLTFPAHIQNDLSILPRSRAATSVPSTTAATTNVTGLEIRNDTVTLDGRPLATGWRTVSDGTDTWYFNVTTQESVWEPPLAA